MTFVVDNSVAMAWCFKDESSDAVMDLLDRAGATGATAPQLWPLEAMNALLVAERRGRITRMQRHRYADLLQALAITIDDETADRVWTTTAQLAETHGMTSYDAAYHETNCS